MKRILLTLAALGTALTMQAKVVLPGIFGDNMVLQQQSEAQFWGKAAPGKKVTIRPSWSTQGITANVGKDGRWRAAVPTPEAGGPYTIELSDGERLTDSPTSPAKVRRRRSSGPGPQRRAASAPSNAARHARRRRSARHNG